jgi:hypothetical protein
MMSSTMMRASRNVMTNDASAMRASREEISAHAAMRSDDNSGASNRDMFAFAEAIVINGWSSTILRSKQIRRAACPNIHETQQADQEHAAPILNRIAHLRSTARSEVFIL